MSVLVTDKLLTLEVCTGLAVSGPYRASPGSEIISSKRAGRDASEIYI